MATDSVVLNDVLCFIKNKYVKMPVKQLKAALMDFYDVEALAVAKSDFATRCGAFEKLSEVSACTSPARWR